MTHYPSTESSAVSEARRQRSLRSCHRFSETNRTHYTPPRESRAYVPELAARLDDDCNLSDGAKRCARKIAELTYRKNREERRLGITVSYLARALGRCRRTVQRYLRQLEGAGYISVGIVAGARSRLCVGLLIDLCVPLFARHHRTRWPGRLGKPGATRMSENQSPLDSLRQNARRYSAEEWAMKCMDGVFRALMNTNPLRDLKLPALH